MNATTQTINTSAHFDIWWRETGQFLQPCDTADSETREQFRLFASKMYGFEGNYYREKFEAVDKELDDTKHDLKTVETREQTLLEDLREALASTDTNTSKIQIIADLVK